MAEGKERTITAYSEMKRKRVGDEASS